MPGAKNQDEKQVRQPRLAFSYTVVRSTEPLDADEWVSRYVAHVVALYETIQRKEAA